MDKEYKPYSKSRTCWNDGSIVILSAAQLTRIYRLQSRYSLPGSQGIDAILTAAEEHLREQTQLDCTPRESWYGEHLPTTFPQV